MKKFEELYKELTENNELKEAWKQAREEEKKQNKISLILFISAILVGLIVIYLIKFRYFLIMPILFIVFFIVIIFAMISTLLKKEYNKYVNLFKKIVIEKLIKNFYNNVEYYPNKGILEKIYKEAEYEEYYNRYTSEDYIEAIINNNYDIELGEVKTVEVETHTDRDGKEHTTTTIKFHGLFSKIVIDKSINCKLKIKQNGSYVFNKNRLELDSRRI